MSINRYSNLKLINNTFISTFPAINPSELEQEDDLIVKISSTQRIDQLAYQYLGDGSLWWMICLLNGMKTPFDNISNKLLRIPASPEYIINILESKFI